MQGTTMDSNRLEAWQKGEKRYSTGRPCRNGHMSQRYTSTGQCVACIRPLKVVRNSFTKELIAYTSPTLWVRNYATPEDYAALGKYLQQCADAFFLHQYPDRPVPLNHAPVQTITDETVPPKGTVSGAVLK